MYAQPEIVKIGSTTCPVKNKNINAKIKSYMIGMPRQKKKTN